MKINVAVTGLNASDNPAPGVAVVRSLREDGNWSGRIIGLSYDAYEPGLFDPHLADSAYLIPYPKEGPEALLGRFRDIRGREEIDVLLPTLDPELENFVKLEAELGALGIRAFLPSLEQLRRRAKSNLPELAGDIDLLVPEIRMVSDLREAEKASQDLDFPLVIKGLFYEAYRASNAAELFSFVQIIAARWGYPVILQKHISGEEYNLAGLGDGSGGLVSAVCMKKVSLTDRGKGWAGVSIHHRGLLEAAGRLASALKWRGGFELEAMMDHDGKLYLIEINPRFPAWIYLAKACGINLPLAYCELALGREPRLPREYKAGTLFVHYTTDLIADMSQLDSLLTRREIHYGKGS